MGEMLSNHTTRNILTPATIMSSHATAEKKKIVLWRGNAELKAIYKCIALTSGHPGKVYLGTAEGDFKEKIL